MAKKVYVGVAGVARNCKSIYLGVSAVARNVKSGYVGVAGVARQFWKSGVVNVTISGRGDTKYSYVIVNGVTYTSAASDITVEPGDVITCYVAGTSGVSGNRGIVTVDGLSVASTTSKTTYDWVVPDGITDIAITLQSSMGDAYGTITIGTVTEDGVIKFAIGDTQYEAIEGMTWAEWCSSSYNTIGAYVDGTIIRTSSSTTIQTNDYWHVSSSDTIEIGGTYTKVTSVVVT